MQLRQNAASVLTIFIAACFASPSGLVVGLAQRGRSADHPSGLEGAGCISGVVLDSEDHPLGQATVEAVDIHRASGAIIPTTKTTKYGTFTLCGLEPGSYTVVAIKEQDYYADPISTFFSDGRTLPEFPLKANEKLENVVIRLGQKCARLKGRIIDSVTGDPVHTIEPETGRHLGKASIEFYEAESPQPYMGTGAGREGEFSLLVPTKPFRMKVSAPGYKSWYYGDDGSEKGAKAILLPSATTKELIVTLERIDDTSH